MANNRTWEELQFGLKGKPSTDAALREVIRRAAIAGQAGKFKKARKRAATMIGEIMMFSAIVGAVVFFGLFWLNGFGLK